MENDVKKGMKDRKKGRKQVKKAGERNEGKKIGAGRKV